MMLTELIQEIKTLPAADLSILIGALQNLQTSQNDTTTTTDNSSICTVDSDISTSTSTSTSGKIVDDSMLTFAQFAQMYREFIPGQMPRCREQDYHTLIEQRIPRQYIEYCFHQTAEAPRPSWAYWRAIMRRLMAEHPDPDHLDDYQRVSHQANRLPEQQYTQRQYERHEHAADPWLIALAEKLSD